MEMIKPGDVKAFSFDDAQRAERIAAMYARMDAIQRWECSFCNEQQRGTIHEMCQECESRRRHRAEIARPRASIMSRAGVPELLRGCADWLADPWPVDPRDGSIDPHEEWPVLAKTLMDYQHRRGPRSLLMRGANGAGKSHRAAELIVRLHRLGLLPAA